MIIALPCDEEGNFFLFTGHTPAFRLYEVEDKKIVSDKIISTGDIHHEGLPKLLHDNNVNVLLCNHMNAVILSLLLQYHIEVCTNVDGEIEDIVKHYLDETLEFSTDPNCPHCH